MYEIIISKTFKKRYEKLPINIKLRVKKLLEKLKFNLIGESLTEDLKGLYSIHFENNRYRILYTKGEERIQIILLYVGKRNDSFYDTFRKNK